MFSRTRWLSNLLRARAKQSHVAGSKCLQSFSTASILRIQDIPTLENGALRVFCQEAFTPARPYLLPPAHYDSIPAVNKWFYTQKSPVNRREGSSAMRSLLNYPYLSQFGEVAVPLEITRPRVTPAEEKTKEATLPEFERFTAPLAFLLEFIELQRSTFGPGSSSSKSTTPIPSLYLAQASLSQLPKPLQDDLPTPELVLSAGKGDVYDSSIWLGLAPTCTPLHRDPNPNLLVQLAGRKIVRLLEPDIGAEVVRNASATQNAPSMRGEEMMMGSEREQLEQAVWPTNSTADQLGWEATLNPGDAIFIPKGWWHSVKGVGEGVVGSVNWWFR